MRALLRRNRDGGAAAVEFALILTPLLLLVFAIIGFGWGFSRWVALTGGAREGVRHLAIYGTNTSPDPVGALAEAIERGKAAAPLACGDGTCTATAVSVPCTPGDNVAFELTMADFTPIALPFLPDLTFAKTARAVMRCGG